MDNVVYEGFSNEAKAACEASDLVKATKDNDNDTKTTTRVNSREVQELVQN